MSKDNCNKKSKALKSKNELNPYGLMNNLLFVLKEAWLFNRPLIFVSAVLIFSQVLQNVCNVFFSKYVVELALLKDNRFNMAIICLLIFFVSGLTVITGRAGNLYLNNKGKYLMSHHFGMLLRNKMMSTDYQNLEKSHINDMFEKANSSADWVSTSALVYRLKNNYTFYIRV